VSERRLEISAEPDGSFVAVADERRAGVVVASWADIRRLRSRHNLDDHWAPGAYEAFVAAHGHPFDDWWAGLGPDVRTALLAEAHGAVPAAYAEVIKRSLRDEPGHDGLRVDGSSFTAAVSDYLAAQRPTG
jgi:hypothetical protein